MWLATSAYGFTEFTSHLFYYYQSGAINESLSDVFGELIDLGNGKGNDAANVRWQLGEDLPIGAIRNMQNPALFNDPDRTGSPNYTADLNELDGGGVHSNSGVNNKAASLMTDGGGFNGRPSPVARGARSARSTTRLRTSLLTSASDYQDLGNALSTACDSLIGQHSITSADCDEVRKVVLATEMLKSPANAVATQAEVCGPSTPINVFFDDMENTARAATGFGGDSRRERLVLPGQSQPGRPRRNLCHQRQKQHLGIRSWRLPDCRPPPVGLYYPYEPEHFTASGRVSPLQPCSMASMILRLITLRWRSDRVQYRCGSNLVDAGPLSEINGYTGTILQVRAIHWPT